MKHSVCKRTTAVLILLALLLPAFPVFSAAEAPTVETRSFTDADKSWYDDHAGDTTFEIGTAGELAYFMYLGTLNHVDYTFNGKTILLTNDIVWNAGTATENGFLPDTEKQGNTVYIWTPYAQNSAAWNEFRGTFDGQGHTISGLYISGSAKRSGFFGVVRGATIQNITFSNAFHCVSGATSLPFAGMVAGDVISGGCTFRNLRISAYQNHTSTGFNSYFGGICGGCSYAATCTLTFDGCSVEGTLNGVRAVGGILGGCNVTTTVNMTDCVCYASIGATAAAGGLVGRQAGAAAFTRCAFFGKLNSLTSSAILFNLRYCNAGSDQTLPASDGDCKAIVLTDCFYPTGTGVYLDRVLNAENNKVAYQVSVLYTKAGVAASTATYRETVATDLSTGVQAQFDSFGFAALRFPASGTDVVKAIAVQTQRDGDRLSARFLGTVTLGDLSLKRIASFGFETAVLTPYAFGSDGAVHSETCQFVYTSVQSDHGLKTVNAADYGADYFTTLVVEEIPTSGMQNLLVRAVYRSAAGNRYYGAWTVVSFLNGQYAGSATLTTADADSDVEAEEPAPIRLRTAVGFDTASYDLAVLLPASAKEIEVYNGQSAPLNGTDVDLVPGRNDFFVTYRNGSEQIENEITVQRREQYRVTFHANGGTPIAARYVADGEKIPFDASVTPVRAGYTFDGWFRTDGSKVYLSNTAIHADSFFVAHWKQIKKFTASNTEPFVYTTSSAALNIVWKDHANAFGFRPERVICTLTDTDTGTAYPVEVRADSASFVSASPNGASVSVGAGCWTVKIAGLDRSKTYTFTQENVENNLYTTRQSGTTAINVCHGFLPATDDTAALITANGRFYDLAGNLVILKGVVTVNVGTVAFAGNTGIPSLARLQAEGVNCIRITMQQSGSAGSNIGYLFGTDRTTPQTAARQEELMALLKTAVNNATSLGMYVIVDWGTLGENPQNKQEGAIAFFTALASAYRDNPYVLYEICNEPLVDSWHDTVLPYAETVISAIRETGSQAVVIVGPNSYAKYISAYTTENAPSDDPIDHPVTTALSYNVAYSFHIYAYNKQYVGVSPEESFGWRMREAVEAGLTIVMTEFSPAISDITAQSQGVTLASIPEANKYLNVALENDVNLFLFRYVSHFASAETSSQHMFEKGINAYLNNGTWTVDQLTESGKWFYDGVLHSDGFIPAADFGN